MRHVAAAPPHSICALPQNFNDLMPHRAQRGDIRCAQSSDGAAVLEPIAIVEPQMDAAPTERAEEVNAVHPECASQG
jgi:hypothetical protein